MTEQEYNDIREYERYLARQRALRVKRKIEEAREREESNGYHYFYSQSYCA